MSLLNVDRKVITKVLSKRLEAVNPHMISTDLTVFFYQAEIPVIIFNAF